MQGYLSEVKSISKRYQKVSLLVWWNIAEKSKAKEYKKRKSKVVCDRYRRG